MAHTSTIASINELIEINNDRIQIYSMAAFKSTMLAINPMLHSLIASSTANNVSLLFEIRKLAGSPIEDTTSLGKLAVLWHAMANAINLQDTKGIILASLDIEAVIIQVYQHALLQDLKYFPDDIVPIIKQQLESLHRDGEMIRQWPRKC
jgi:uncharacterized protein (TIGR02284 family)